VSEPIANEAVSEVPAQETTPEVVSEAVETPAVEATADAVVETEAVVETPAAEAAAE
jgi:hypothetical protein